MEEDLLNTSVDSWDGDEDINKIIDLTNTTSEALSVGGLRGEKYKLTTTRDDKQWFAKECIDGKQPLEIACCSAMLSCFSHTPYPVGVRKINNKDFIVFRYDKNDNLKEEEIKNIKPFIDTFCTVAQNQNGYCFPLIDNIKKYGQQFKSLSDNHKRNIIQLCTQIIFFNLYDRKYDNIFFHNSSIVHMDVDFKNKFMFANNFGNQIRPIMYFLAFLKEAINDDKMMEKYLEYFQLTINKIKDIDYKTFLKRYIRNCIVLGYDEEKAYSYLNNTFLKNMRTFWKNEGKKGNNIYRYLFNTQHNVTLYDASDNEKKITISTNSDGNEYKNPYLDLLRKSYSIIYDKYKDTFLKDEVDKEDFNNMFTEIKEKLKLDTNDINIDNQPLLNKFTTENNKYEKQQSSKNNVESGSDNHGCSYYAKQCLSLCDCCGFCKNAG